jgi:hypothetical protein
MRCYLVKKNKIMISLTTIGDHYIFQRPLLGKHQETLEWLSAIVLWKNELSFFQKLLDRHVSKMSAAVHRTQAEHFQNVIIYFKCDVIDSLTTRLRQHEEKLSEMLESRNESKTEYIGQHEGLMNELALVNSRFIHFRHELFAFVETII